MNVPKYLDCFYAYGVSMCYARLNGFAVSKFLWLRRFYGFAVSKFLWLRRFYVLRTFQWLRRFYVLLVLSEVEVRTFNFVEGFAVLWLRRFKVYVPAAFEWLRRFYASLFICATHVSNCL